MRSLLLPSAYGKYKQGIFVGIMFFNSGPNSAARFNGVCMVKESGVSVSYFRAEDADLFCFFTRMGELNMKEAFSTESCCYCFVDVVKHLLLFI